MRILFVVHGFPPAATGGTEIYALDLARALRRQSHEVRVLARVANRELPEYAVTRHVVGGVPVTLVNNTFLGAASFEETYRNAAIDAVAGAAIDEFRPDVVHVHHLTCLSTGIVAACRQRGLPAVITLQDYWLLCHRGQLLDLDLERCDGPAADRCSRCAGFAASPRPGLHAAARALRSVERRLPARLAAAERRLVSAASRRFVPRGASGATARRLEEARSVCRDAACLLAPSQTIFDTFQRFGVRPEKMRRQDQGIDLRPFQAVTRTRGERLRLGFVGSLMVSKAPHLFIEAAAGLPRDRVEVTLAGGHAAYHGDDGYAKVVRPLLEQPWVRWIGPVPHEEMPRVLSALDVLVVPSIWLENSPFVIREARAAGAAVVASRLGGMAEAISDGRDGLLFEPGNASDLRRVLARLLDEQGLLDRLRAGARPVRSIEDDAAWTAEVYEEACDQGRASRGVRRNPAGNASARARIGAVVLNYRAPDDTLLAARSLEASHRPVEPIIVVDNDGDGSCARSLAAGRSRATLVKMRSNRGFAGGCNAGIHESLRRGADLVVLLNSDAVVAPDTVERLEAALAADPGAGIAAPLVVSRADPGTIASAGIRFSPVSGRMRQEGAGKVFDGMAGGPAARVAAVSGAVMLIRRAVFEQAGLFDERYFYSFEDVEFCWRAARSGWGTLLVPSALAWHEGHRSIGPQSAARLYFAARNHLLLARTAAPASPPVSWLRGAAIVLLNAAHAARTPGVGVGRGLLAVATGTRDHLRGRYGPAPRKRA
ncbi:MAG: glycosyltransferase [Acidobacteria bacterium]|nr:glycosyltransferase [Acidobacteriota bacterium]